MTIFVIWQTIVTLHSIVSQLLNYSFFMQTVFKIYIWNICRTCFYDRRWSIGKQIRPFTRYPCCMRALEPAEWKIAIISPQTAPCLMGLFTMRLQLKANGCRGTCYHMFSRKATMVPKPTKWPPKNWEAFQSWWEVAISKHCAKCKQCIAMEATSCSNLYKVQKEGK